MARMRIQPLLERIDRRHPREESDDPFQMYALRAGVVGFVVEDVQMIRTEQLHRHAGHFAEFHGGVTQEHEWFIPRRDRMKRMTGLVEQRFNITLQSRGVHEDKGLADLVQCRLIAAGLLPLTAVQV